MNKRKSEQLRNWWAKYTPKERSEINRDRLATMEIRDRMAQAQTDRAHRRRLRRIRLEDGIVRR